MDKNAFFRQATLRICENLEIQDAMVSFLQFISDLIPTDRLFLERYDKTLSAMRTIVDATQAGGKRVDILTPLSQESITSLRKKYGSSSLGVYYYDNPSGAAVARDLLAFHNQSAASLMVLPLGKSSDWIGSVVLVSENHVYNDTHAELMSLLKEPFAVAMSNALKHAEVVMLKDILSDDNRYLQGELHRRSGDGIVGSDYGLKNVMHKVQQVAGLNSPVLLLGETGAGKDVIANAIHYASNRHKGPFISVNCGAIPENLIDSELFGHEKAAFTGALSQKRGRFERANKGTIFLDEIGELPPAAQVRFLRVLQNREIERVGGSKTIPLDIRIIAATNRDLEAMIKNRQFREDLWFRLNVFPIRIPPLRDRSVDIPALVQHFILLKSKELNRPRIPVLSPGAIDPLMAYHWPGNVRELANIIERSMILNPSGPLTFEHLFPKSAYGKRNQLNSGEATDNLDEVISRHISGVLAKTDGKINGPGGAAELLGINPSTLRGRMKKLNIGFGKKDVMDHDV